MFEVFVLDCMKNEHLNELRKGLSLLDICLIALFNNQVTYVSNKDKNNRRGRILNPIMILRLSRLIIFTKSSTP